MGGGVAAMSERSRAIEPFAEVYERELPAVTRLAYLLVRSHGRATSEPGQESGHIRRPGLECRPAMKLLRMAGLTQPVERAT